MEHFLVLTDDVDKTRDFYCDALDLKVGFRPELEFAGYWIYLGDVPAVHIADHTAYIDWTRKVGIPISSGPPGTGALDHIAFNCEGYAEVKRSLEAKGIAISCNELDEIKLKQIFLSDPNGLGIELNFNE